MGGMFQSATSFNQDISSWITTNVVSFIGMFAFAASFNQDISMWSVGSACSLGIVFYGASSFNQDLNPWQQQLVRKDCFDGRAPDVAEMFLGSACPVQTTTLPGDFCQVACGNPGKAEFNAVGTSFPQGQYGQLYSAVRCILHNQ
jgi:surface protein